MSKKQHTNSGNIKLKTQKRKKTQKKHPERKQTNRPEKIDSDRNTNVKNIQKGEISTQNLQYMCVCM